jgi:hypothetical protein
MKRQIRKGVFETNSSSTHSIAIPKNSSRTLRYVEFCTNDFGWEFNQVSPDDYFYTAIYETSDTECEVNTKIEKLKNILNEHGITYDFAEPKTHTWHSDSGNKDYFSLDDGYIDHGYELKEFVDELLNDGDKLVRFLSGGLVFTGNDNSEMDYVNRTERLIEDYDWGTRTSSYHENPYYMDNHEDYEWYYKGN